FAATNFSTWTRQFNHPGGSMPVVFNVYPGDDTSATRASLDKVITMLGTLGDLYGPYPFINEKDGVYEFNFGGGMEHQTDTGQGFFDEVVTVHELGHQWWGDNVTCKTWSDIWLNEGFATYTEALWEEHKPGSTGFPALRSAMVGRRWGTSGTVYRTVTTSS